MKTLLIIGIGPGHPDQVTVQAVDAMRRTDVFFLIDKGGDKSALAGARQEILERHVPGASARTVTVADVERDRDPDDYLRAVADWHDARGAVYQRLIDDHLADDGVGAFLVWGDPSVYDSALRIVELLAGNGSIDYEVVPGITAVQALTAAHRVALTPIAGSARITTGRRLPAATVSERETVAVMLDGSRSFERVDDDVTIYWGANVGTQHEALVAGELSAVIDEIRTRRAEVKQAAGWVMDSYLLVATPRRAS